MKLSPFLSFRVCYFPMIRLRLRDTRVPRFCSGTKKKYIAWKKKMGNDRSRCVYLSCRDVNRFVEDQPHRRFPTSGMRCTALVSHVTGGIRKKAFQRQVADRCGVTWNIKYWVRVSYGVLFGYQYRFRYLAREMGFVTQRYNWTSPSIILISEFSSLKLSKDSKNTRWNYFKPNEIS